MRLGVDEHSLTSVEDALSPSQCGWDALAKEAHRCSLQYERPLCRGRFKVSRSLQLPKSIGIFSPTRTLQGCLRENSIRPQEYYQTF